MTHFVCYLEKEIGRDIEALSIDRELLRNIFMEKSCRKYAPNASNRSLLNFVK